MVKIISIVVVCIMLSGCFASLTDTTNNSVYGGQYTELWFLTRVSMKLKQMSKAENLKGLDALSSRYGVDVTAPTVDLFDSADRFIVAMQDLQKAIRAKTTTGNRDIEDNQTASDEMLQAIQDVDTLITIFEEVPLNE